MIKVLIITEGGGKLGWGHLTRCQAIAQALEQYQCQFEVIIRAEGELPGFVTGPSWHVKDWLKDDQEAIGRCKGQDYIIVDSAEASDEFFWKIHETNPHLVIIDDNCRLYYSPAIIVNPNIYAAALPYVVSQEVWGGPSFVLVRRAFWDLPSRTAGPVRMVAVLLSGEEWAEWRFNILRFFEKNSPAVTKLVVVRDKISAQKELSYLTDTKVQVLEKLDDTGMVQALRDTDVAISGCGQTLAELACLGIPAVGICLSEMERRNGRAWVQAGFSEVMFPANPQDCAVQLPSHISRLLEPMERQKRIARAAAMIDGRGAIRLVINLIGRKELASRPAVQEDCRDIWQWRNDPATRQADGMESEISYDDHYAWFMPQLSDSDVSMYLFEDRSGQKAGFVCMNDVANQRATIHVDLNPALAAKGYGGYCIAEATRQFLRQFESCLEILASVSAENTLMLNAFKDAGYKVTERPNRDADRNYHLKLKRYDG